MACNRRQHIHFINCPHPQQRESDNQIATRNYKSMNNCIYVCCHNHIKTGSNRAYIATTKSATEDNTHTLSTVYQWSCSHPQQKTTHALYQLSTNGTVLILNRRQHIHSINCLPMEPSSSPTGDNTYTLLTVYQWHRPHHQL